MNKRILASLLALTVALTANAVIYAKDKTDAAEEEIAVTSLDEAAEEAALETESVSISLTIGVNSIVKNGEEKELDVAPMIINDRTMVPLRAIFEALGAVVEWDDETKTVFAVKDDMVMVMQIGQSKLYLNNDEIALDSPAVIVDSRTLVPARAIAEAFGNKVDYNAETQTVTITDATEEAAEEIAE